MNKRILIAYASKFGPPYAQRYYRKARREQICEHASCDFGYDDRGG